MKRISNKGFTLIELLAVIVILAIILVVSIPAVIGAMEKARLNAFRLSANTIADWIEKEYALTIINTPDSTFSDVCVGTVTGSSDNDLGGGDYCQIRFVDTRYNVENGPILKAVFEFDNLDEIDKIGKLSVVDLMNNSLAKLGATSEIYLARLKTVYLLKAAGVDPENYGHVYIKITDGRACVKLISSSTKGAFKSLKGSNRLAKSAGCN